MEEKQKILVLQGIPCSGKTTWAKDFLKGKSNWIRISRDDLRNMRGDYWVESQEDFISKIEQLSLHEALNAGYSVLIDATNLNIKAINLWKEIATNYSINIEFKYFPVTLKTALERDKKRDKPIGEKVIKRFYYKYNKDDERDVRNYKEQDKTLPRAIICDIDGTIALGTGRSPFEFDKIDTDEVNVPVAELLKTYSPTHEIILLSGRNEGDKEDNLKVFNRTYNWLEENKIPFNYLFMKEWDDYRKDSIVKKELYDDHVLNKFHVDFVLDDRNQVVDMWREIGLPCFQVWYGDF